MMLKRSLWSLVVTAMLAGSSSFAQTKSVVDLLAGEWTGTVTGNKIPDALKANKSLTTDLVGTPALIKLEKSKDLPSLSGTSTVGGGEEKWSLSKETYTWDDVTTKLVATFPQWMQDNIDSDLKKEKKKTEFDSASVTTVAYQYHCDKPEPKDCDQALKNAHWIFTLIDSTEEKILYVTVYNSTEENPADGQKRIFTERLTQKK